MTFTMLKLRRAFTLVEIMVALAVLSLVTASSTGIYFSMQQSWQRQSAFLDLIQNIRWSEEFISNEIRATDTVNVLAGGDRLWFNLDTNSDNISDTQVWYWRGDSGSDTAGLGDRTYLYRGTGNNINQAYLSRQQLANFIIDNSNGNDIFVDAGGLLTVELTASKNNRNYNLRNKIRTRN